MLLSASAVHSHHSTTPVYASNRIVTKTGVVSSFRLVNPHAMLTLDVAEEDSTVVPWIVEFDGRLNLTRFGWTDETLKTGEVITVTGNPTHNDSPRMFFLELERSDGTRLRRPIVDQLIGTLEDARRQRAEGKPQ
jgi:hypothetical protein